MFQSDKWPFTPTRLSEIIDSETLAVVEAGCSSRLGRALTILDYSAEGLEPIIANVQAIGTDHLAHLHLPDESLCLALFTDGLTDSMSPLGEPFGAARLRAFLEAHGDLPPRELCDAMFAELTTFQAGAEQFDDMAVLVTQVG